MTNQTSLPIHFAISRRFTSSAVEATYRKILPVLREFGSPVECSNANFNRHSSSHWLAKMALIFDCCPVHILVDLERSKSTLYEFEYSNLSTYFDKKDVLVALFDCRPIYEHKPIRIIIRPHHSARSTPTLYPNPLRKKFLRKKYIGSDIEITYRTDDEIEFLNELRRKLTMACEVVGNRRKDITDLHKADHSIRSNHHAYRYAYRESLLFLDGDDFEKLAIRLMDEVLRGESVDQIKSKISTPSPLSEPNRWNERDYDFEDWNLRSAYAISQINQILDRLVERLSAVLEQPHNVQARYLYLRDFLSIRNLQPDSALHDELSLLELFEANCNLIDRNRLSKLALRVHCIKQAIFDRHLERK